LPFATDLVDVGRAPTPTPKMLVNYGATVIGDASSKTASVDK
jgi:hypothetical protein